MPSEMAKLLVKVQLGDNRNVDEATVIYWLDTIGDLDFDAAVDALRRFRRERPGTYLEPGHLLDYAGVATAPDPWAHVRDLDMEGRRAALEAAVPAAVWSEHGADDAWVLEHTRPAERLELTTFDENGHPES